MSTGGENGLKNKKEKSNAGKQGLSLTNSLERARMFYFLAEQAA
jgi:hypothetical protein